MGRHANHRQHGRSVVNRPRPARRQIGPPPLTAQQTAASSPQDHVWLHASAGTGKTHVLVARVLRLLLDGVPPERILCLTFTKAGAAEMANRINDRLSRWVRMPEEQLNNEIASLSVMRSHVEQDFARSLFARVLDVPGGIAIQTIHSFCQSLLSAFPLEADLVPGFRAIEEGERQTIARDALVRVLELADGAVDRSFIERIEALARGLGEARLSSFLFAAIRHGDAMLALHEPMDDIVRAAIDLPQGDAATVLAQACADDRIDRSALHVLALAYQSWDTKTGRETANGIVRWLGADPAQRAAMVDDFSRLFLTWDGKPKAIPQKLPSLHPEAENSHTIVTKLMMTLRLLPQRLAYADQAATALAIGRDYVRMYRALKRVENVVDFDEQIATTARLLGNSGMGAWINYKLDQRIDHVLVDEAQDTNADQWAIVDALVDEYFAGSGARDDSARTLFVVGDHKQAIFGFQGTSPEAFARARRQFVQRATSFDQPFHQLPLDQSFRTVPAVLEAVDAVLANLGPAAIGLDTPPEPHVSAQPYPGAVTIWPPVYVAPVDDSAAGESGEAGEDGDDEHGWLSSAERRLADKIAATVRDWVNGGAWLESAGRSVRPGDIMVLVRTRAALAGLIVAQLHAAGVPVAGIDRLRLQAPLAIQDLMATLRFAVQPRDDLTLAALLVSPLIGWNHDALDQRGRRPKGRSLWRHLRETGPVDDVAMLRDLLALADLVTPYQFLQHVLGGPMRGRRKIVARLGAEANDPINELLNQALLFERQGPPSLQGFISWFDRNPSDIKRESESARDEVQVMTVHGSKGLEAPIVILADAAGNPDGRQRHNDPLVIGNGPRAFPMPALRPALLGGPAQAAWEHASRVADEEHWRLLYVAMTRAREQLYVTGALSPRTRGVVPVKSWLARVGQALDHLGAEELPSDRWGIARVWRGARSYKPKAPQQESPPAVAPSVDATVRPAWIDCAAPAESRPPRPLTPSMSIDDLVPYPPAFDDDNAAALRGVLLHRLFERLPDVDEADRATVADRWLRRQGCVDDPAERADLFRHVQAVLNSDDHAMIFTPDALAEAPITAVVDGQVIAGTVDRLLITTTHVHVVDFKTGRRVPASIDAVPPSHIRQMAAYAAALGVIFPDRMVEASLLYTAGPVMHRLPPDLLALHKPGFTG